MTTDTNPTAQLSTLEAIRSFILAGHAIFTIVSKRTGERRTYKVQKSEPSERYPKPGFFVRFLHGPDNTSDYRYFGFMYETDAGELRIKMGKSDASNATVDAYKWLLAHINATHLQWAPAATLEERNARFFSQAEFWHAGRCGRCGRLLTTPESIASGIGPVCAGME